MAKWITLFFLWFFVKESTIFASLLILFFWDTDEKN